MPYIYMEAKLVRQRFFDYFKSRGHEIVSSAPIVNSNDPTLMFTNAGMNQFKDNFLGNQVPEFRRVADTQKCLRVSGKHNDLEEVGVDGYHHTMFEMLGNWSFGDYFKEEAIAWAWELLVDEFKLEKGRLYVTVFGGDEAEGLDADQEAASEWEKWIEQDRILYFDKKDNFWEMGDTGPCGPCSEIHIDLRDDAERTKQPGDQLVNKDHPLVVEIWNLVFIQFNRKADRSLESLPEKHIDTGMGFERLCMALQDKRSNYDTDVFTPYFQFLEERTGIKYTGSYDSGARTDMAMRVLADHIRAVCFTIADGALPGNTGAGYVIRRILRRAVRYYYSFLDVSEPLLYEMVPIVAGTFADTFSEVQQQETFIGNVVKEEEKSFLHTLEEGLKRIEQISPLDGVIAGEDAFELYDTFGFPIDLTRLIAREKGLSIDEEGFDKALAQQRNRSKADARKEVGDWFVLSDEKDFEFVGYDQLELKDARIVKYRTVSSKGKDQYQIVLDRSPFYAEGGGQVGDTGILKVGDEEIKVLDTLRENDLFVHIVNKLPRQMDQPVTPVVEHFKRRNTERNHSATHLLHAALRTVLGDHVTQKGSLVNDKYLRFDFSHFKKLTVDELKRVELIVNQKIRQNVAKGEMRDLPLEEAKKAGAMMLFGEKYGSKVRMITFDPEFSRELCGGCHVEATGNIGVFKITGESSVAAGVRRIEAVTGESAEQYLNDQLGELQSIKELFKSPLNVPEQVSSLLEENKRLQKELDRQKADQVGNMKGELKNKTESIDGVNFLAVNVDADDSKALKNLAYQLEKELGDAFIFFAADINEKPMLMLTISSNLTEERGLHAGNIIRELAKEIKGGGGGQPFFATAGGKDSSGLDRAVEKSKSFLLN